MNRSADIDILAQKGKLIPANWQTRLPNNSVPSASPTVFLVRKGNPKQVKDWDDLVRPGVTSVIPNPKTSGNGKYSYLAAWGYVTQKGGDAAKARQFVTELFKHVPVLDTGGRGATTTFAQREIGDVLVTFENEVYLLQKELGEDKYEVVYPSVTVLAENPVSLVDKVVDKKGTRKVAQAYLEFHFSPQGQALAAKHYLRPQVSEVAQPAFKKLHTFTVKQEGVTMTQRQSNQEPEHVIQLRAELKHALSLDLEELGLLEASSGEYESTFIGVHLKTAFQPIYDAKQGDIYGYEALIRPSLFGTLGSTPEFAFTYAEQSGKLVQFDRVCRSQHVLNYRAIHQETACCF
ncbi:Sulfate-binding protein precursor, putative [Ricinus communis]|uniref:Sulfate-binding protein, putative n=1 Tax=Ricinus communis TaxID=3988 RepID=B9TFZ2_RICCO|nr:Sulfate-binding protein precursor, putative [Ricinus communis]